MRDGRSFLNGLPAAAVLDRTGVDWTAVAARITFIPGQFGLYNVDESAAKATLHCDDGALDTLCAAGLPFDDDSGQRLFDHNDIYNLG